ncbi:uncharacterized protein G2W53_026364 [Senna tora]|uniref:Uncharacterized protein n=1 Tax=Senna tora TaxID=362788 RepID=A0A834WL59_9FABA|nr:uncharacterized protein G2W53_026364 [Senna tora]
MIHGPPVKFNLSKASFSTVIPKGLLPSASNSSSSLEQLEDLGSSSEAYSDWFSSSPFPSKSKLLLTPLTVSRYDLLPSVDCCSSTSPCIQSSSLGAFDLEPVNSLSLVRTFFLLRSMLSSSSFEGGCSPFLPNDPPKVGGASIFSQCLAN